MSGAVSPGSMPFHGGLLMSHIAGRSDYLPVDVAKGCYVIPADVVSGLGEGNTLAGGKALDRVFETPKAIMLAPNQHMVPIVVAGGEYIVHPWRVAQIGMGDIKHGHDALDLFVKKIRAKTIRQMSKLPGPQR